MLDLGRRYAAIRHDILAAIERVCSSQHFILGEEVRSLEREVAAFLGISHAVAARPEPTRLGSCWPPTA
jgi:dTDP-4-amino-4,6-dideoxygalactose transaminase